MSTVEAAVQTDLYVPTPTVETTVQTDLCVPVSTVEVSIQTESVATSSKVAYTEDMPPYTPLVVESIIRKLRIELA